MCPCFAAYCRNGIAEGKNRFWIPCGGPWFELSRFGEFVRAKRDNGEQPQQGWCGAQDCLVGPLTLGFDAEMRADFLEGNFDLPADRHRWHAAAIPDCGAAGDLDDAIGSAVPETDAAALPADFAILEDSGELFQSLTFDRRPAAAFVLLRREGEQVGIEPQPCDDAEMAAHRGQEFDGCERAVSDEYDVAIGEPATDLQGSLPGPIEQRLGGA